MTVRIIVSARGVACPKYGRFVPYKHYQSAVSATEVTCSTCNYKRSITCNGVKCDYPSYPAK